MGIKLILWRSSIIAVFVIFLASCSTGSENAPAIGNIDTPINEQPGTDNSSPDVDTDGDGIVDSNDAFPDDPVRTALLPQEFDIGVTYSRELFVSTTGNDNTGDGTEAFPYASVETAAHNATPGTRINLQPGTYPADGFIENLQGTENEPIAIVANGNVVFDAAGDFQVMHLRDPRYVVLQGFTVENTSGHGINIDDGGSYSTPAEHVIVRGLTFRNIGSGNNNDCLKMSGVDRFLVLDSEFDNCDEGEAIDMVGCHEGVVKGNFFHNIPRNAINTKGGSSEVLIQANRFADVASRAINAGGSTGLEFFRPSDAPYEGARIRMLANIFERVGSFAGAPVAFVGCDLCVFANNTIIEPPTYIARILQESTQDRFVPSRNGYFINNIIVFNESELNSYVNIGPDTAPETFTFSSNLWFALDNSGFTGPNLPGVIPAETNSIIQQDPLIDLVNAIYTIPLSSPAAGNGREVPGSIENDFAGTPYISPLDIGAYKAQ